MSNGHQQEQDLIARYLEQGDERLFEVLLDRYQNSVFRVALSVLGPCRIPDAEDVTQEVFVRAQKGLRAFRGESGQSGPCACIGQRRA
jgi:DNA-directed RNA polymerase specialized sigma24 family protein